MATAPTEAADAALDAPATEQTAPTQTPATNDDSVITLGQPGVELSNFDRYVGRKNVTDRLAFVSSHVRRGWTYYINKQRILLPKDPKLQALLRQKEGEPRQEFVIVVFHYSTDEDGNFLPGTENKCAGKMKYWRWSEAKYGEYSDLNKKWPIMDTGRFDSPQHDLLIKCTEERYQRMTTTVDPVAHWKRNQRWYQALIEKRQKADAKIMSVLGFDKTEAELLEILGASGTNPTQTDDSAGAVDLSDVLD